MERSPTLLVMLGLIDMSQTGNQTLKNTLLYYAKAGYNLTLLTALPSDYPDLLPYEEAFGNLADKITAIRLPHFLSKGFYLIRRIKNHFRRERRSNAVTSTDLPTRYQDTGPQSYFADLSSSSQAIYFLAWIGYTSVVLVQGFVQIIRKRPNLIYGYEVFGAPAAGVLGKIFGIPVVTRFQGTPIPMQNGKTSFWRYPHLILGTKSPSDAVIMANDGTHGDEVLKSLAVPAEKVHFWVNGLEVEPLEILPSREEVRQEMGLGAEIKIILMLNRLVFWKRIDRGIRAVATLKKTLKYHGLLLLIVGGGPERDNLEKLTEQLNVRDSVRFMGSVPHCEVGKYYRLTDVFLQINDVSNLGNPLLEAMYYGCCVITLDDKSTEGIIKHEWNGLLVGMDNVEVGLPQAIDRVLRNEALRENLRGNARDYAEQNLLSWEERMKKEIEVVERLMKSKTR